MKEKIGDNDAPNMKLKDKGGETKQAIPSLNQKLKIVIFTKKKHTG